MTDYRPPSVVTTTYSTDCGPLRPPADDYVACPACDGSGVLTVACSTCNGTGSSMRTASAVDGVECPSCGGTGVEDAGTCVPCAGTSEVRAAYALLYVSARNIARRYPTRSPIRRTSQFAGESYADTSDGVTQASLAAYTTIRGRFALPVTVEVRGESGGDTSRHTVTITSDDIDTAENTTLTLRGLAWGYGGEGPTGLAVILADLGFVTSLAAGRRWVQARSAITGWSMIRYTDTETLSLTVEERIPA